jgi:hypothetical protein
VAARGDDILSGLLQIQSLPGSPFLGEPEFGITGGVADEDQVVDATHSAPIIAIACKNSAWARHQAGDAATLRTSSVIMPNISRPPEVIG